VYRLTLVLPAVLLSVLSVSAQQPKSPAPATKSSAYAAIPVDAAKTANPVKITPESLARGKKWWTLDCAMCHGASGDGKGETGKDMKLTLADFTDPATLKDRTDGEILYLIKNGYADMPPEGDRVKGDEGWDLVNYVRSLAKKDAEAKAQ
jgi:mono/diheme cytochrome c family protein